MDLEVTRAEFEAIISDQLVEFRVAVQDTLDKVQFAPQEIDLVIRTGGSSLIPAVKAILSTQFPDRVVEHDPFTSVAGGLAIAEYYGLGTALPKNQPWQRES